VQHGDAQQQGDRRVEVSNDRGPHWADLADEGEEQQEGERRADHRQDQDRQQDLAGRQRPWKLRHCQWGIEEGGQRQ
jgi:hypothetical protein